MKEQRLLGIIDAICFFQGGVAYANRWWWILAVWVVIDCIACGAVRTWSKHDPQA